MRLTWLSSLCIGTALLVGSDRAPDPPDVAWDVQTALDRALGDERRAILFYQAVMARHGQRRPFSNIIEAERRHESALLAEYARLQLEAPATPRDAQAPRVPETFAAACDAAIVAEHRNVRMYDELLCDIADERVRAVFERLRAASLERHLPAFSRHGSGWADLNASELNPDQQIQRETAERARHAMFSALMARLSEAIASGGADSAIAVCAQEAPEIAQRLAREHGVRIGRTSWKLRNSANDAPVWAQLLVDERPEEERVRADRTGRLGVLMPIRLSAPCLQCHGPAEDLAAPVRERLAELYPNDEATGFEVGDLRGWFWIEVPAMQVPDETER